MNSLMLVGACLAAFLAVVLFPSDDRVVAAGGIAKLRFDVSFPASASKEPLDGRLLLLISTNNEKEPRFQISEDLSTQQVFGVDVDGWKAGQTQTVDATAFGYPLRSLDQVKPGEYWVQALLHRDEAFHRADGHTVQRAMAGG